jgi:hypothetical protein
MKYIHFSLQHIRLGVGNNLLQLLDMLGFEINETLGNSILNILLLRFFPYIDIYNENPLYETALHNHEQKKCMLHCAARVCYPQQTELDSMAELMQCIVHAPIRLTECESCSCSSKCHAVTVNSRQEL